MAFLVFLLFIVAALIIYHFEPWIDKVNGKWGIWVNAYGRRGGFREFYFLSR